MTIIYFLFETYFHFINWLLCSLTKLFSFYFLLFLSLFWIKNIYTHFLHVTHFDYTKRHFWLSITHIDTSYMWHTLLWDSNKLWTILPLIKTTLVDTQVICGWVIYGRVMGDLWTSDAWLGYLWMDDVWMSVK